MNWQAGESKAPGPCRASSQDRLPPAKTMVKFKVSKTTKDLILISTLMTNSFPTASRRAPDLITEELVKALSESSSLEFKPLLDIVLSNVRARKRSTHTEELMRLRTYERLQALVIQGMVEKPSRKMGSITEAALPLRHFFPLYQPKSNLCLPDPNR